MSKSPTGKPHSKKRPARAAVRKPVRSAARPARAKRYVVNEQIGFMLRVAMQRHTAIFTSMMIGGITQTQFAALTKLLEVGPCSHNRLGRLIALDAPTIKGVLDRLQLRGLVVSVADDTHRSRRLVQLTKVGAATTRRAAQIGNTITKATLAPLCESERNCLIRLLDRIMGDKHPSASQPPRLASSRPGSTPG